jgi:hypothetical protein
MFVLFVGRQASLCGRARPAAHTSVAAAVAVELFLCVLLRWFVVGSEASIVLRAPLQTPASCKWERRRSPSAWSSTLAPLTRGSSLPKRRSQSLRT